MNKIDFKKYPELLNIEESGRERFIEEIFDMGYKMMFDVKCNPTDYISENLYFRNVFSDLVCKLNINNVSENKNMTSSYKKGEIGELDLEISIKNYFPHYVYKVTRTTSNCGDAHIFLPNGDIIMLESKYYNTLVTQKEIDKMKFDMIKTHINKGIFISHTSNIANIDNIKAFDIIEFIHNNKVHIIYCIPNYNNNIIKLQCIFQLIECSSKYNNNKIYCNSLKILLNELSEIINQNKNTMEKDFDDFNKSIKSLNNIMNNYKNSIYDIIIKIETKIKDYSKKEEILNKIIDKHSKNTSINKVFKDLGDILIQYGCMLIETENNKCLILDNDSLPIANIKILKGKISITFKNNNETKYDIDNKKNELSSIIEQLDELITK